MSALNCQRFFDIVRRRWFDPTLKDDTRSYQAAGYTCFHKCIIFTLEVHVHKNKLSLTGLISSFRKHAYIIYGSSLFKEIQFVKEDLREISFSEFDVCWTVHHCDN